MSDGRVLNALAEELDVDLGLPTVEAARAELLQLGHGHRPRRRRRRSSAAPAPARSATARPVLATWHELIDAGRMQDGDEHLAGTAKPVRARISAGHRGRASASPTATSCRSAPTPARSCCRSLIDRDARRRRVAADQRARLRGAGRRSARVAGSTVRLVRADAPPVVGVGARRSHA